MLQKFNEVSKRIRTLTTVLQGLKAQADPTNHHQEIPQFLYHLVNLVTCGDACSPTMAKVVAATGTFESDGTARVLIVTDSTSTVSTLSIKKIPKVAKSFQDVLNGYVQLNCHTFHCHLTVYIGAQMLDHFRSILQTYGLHSKHMMKMHQMSGLTTMPCPALWSCAVFINSQHSLMKTSNSSLEAAGFMKLSSNGDQMNLI